MRCGDDVTDASCELSCSKHVNSMLWEIWLPLVGVKIDLKRGVSLSLRIAVDNAILGGFFMRHCEQIASVASEVSPAAAAIYAHVLSSCDAATGEMRVSQLALAAKANRGERTSRHWLAELVKAGLIERFRQFDHKTGARAVDLIRVVGLRVVDRMAALLAALERKKAAFAKRRKRLEQLRSPTGRFLPNKVREVYFSSSDVCEEVKIDETRLKYLAAIAALPDRVGGLGVLEGV